VAPEDLVARGGHYSYISLTICNEEAFLVGVLFFLQLIEHTFTSYNTLTIFFKMHPISNSNLFSSVVLKRYVNLKTLYFLNRKRQ
jgi:hypothetical protein